MDLHFLQIIGDWIANLILDQKNSFSRPLSLLTKTTESSYRVNYRESAKLFWRTYLFSLNLHEESIHYEKTNSFFLSILYILFT